MDEVEACSSHEQQEDTSSASVATKPVRRRRLAHRRQYAKSRRIASSSLRAQFVRYDALSNYYHDSDDSSWHRTDAKSTENLAEPTKEFVTNKIEIFQNDHDSGAENIGRDKLASMDIVQNNHQTPISPNDLPDVRPINVIASPPTIFPRQRNSRPEIPVPLTRLTGELHSSSMPSPKIRAEISTELDIRALGDYSSSSLDSCSLVDSHWENSNYRTPYSPSLTPSAAHSLNHLSNHSVYYTHNQQCQFVTNQYRSSDQYYSQRDNTGVQRISQDKSKPLVIERVVRSETVDLDRIRLNQQKGESPRSKFFSGVDNFRAWASSEQQVTGSHKPQLSPRVVDHKPTTKSSYSSDNFPPLQCSTESTSPLRDKRRGKSEDCIDNVHFNDLFHGTVTDSSSVTVNQSVRTDPRLYKDDVDIKFSRALNSCKLPQIRYASKERLFERLTDLRFLSIDFLNTFLLTYRVFTSAEDVLEALKSVHYNSDRYFQQQQSQQHHPGPHQRDSFSAFANSSLVSLNNANSNIGYSSNNDESIVYESTQSNLANKTPNITDTGQLNSTPTHGATGDKISKEVAPRSLAPLNIRSQHQQSRPSVPPRSPGADTDVRLNLHIGDAFLLAPNAHQHSKRRSTISALTPITGSNSSSLANLAQNLSSSAAQSQLAMSGKRQLSSCSNSPNTQSYISDAEEPWSEFPGGEIKSPNSPGMERARSSSTSARPVSSIHDSQTGSNLAVPGVRQTRAASLSLTPSVKLTESGNSTQPVMSGISGSNEHWRLSYKKTQNDSLSSNTNPPNSHILGANKYSNATTSRRASSADINVSLQVTPVKQSVDTNWKLSDDEALSPISHQPGVPPSTPVEAVVAEVEVVSYGNKLAALNSNPWRDSRLEVDLAVKSPISSNDNLNLATESNKQQQYSSPKDFKASTTSSSSLVISGSSSSLSTSSASTSLVASSQSESGLIQSNSSIDDTPNDQLKNRVDSNTKESVGKDTESSKRRKTRRSTKNKVGRRLSAQQVARHGIHIIKEIDLTQTKLLDCDTSADEDKVSTSSGDYTDPDGNDSDASDNDKNIEQIETVHEKTEEERNFKILTKLNSVKIDDSDDELKIKTMKGRVKGMKEIQAIDEVDQKIREQDGDLEETHPLIVNQLDQTSPLENCPSPTPSPSRASQSTSSRTPEVAKSTAIQTSGLQSIPNNSRMTTPRSSFQHHTSDSPLTGEKISKAGVIVTASAPRVSSRRSSTASAASAFAAATAASNNPLLTQPPQAMRHQLPNSIHSRSSNELTVKQTCDFVGQLDSGPCTCAAIRRGSCTTSQAHLIQQKQSGRIVSHHPTCAYFQQVLPASSISPIQPNYYPNTHSDASSLCNSRASSRLSSCAGLEYSSHSSAQVNFYAHQQMISRGQCGSQAQSLRGSNAGQIGRIYPASSRSKRNSTQINIRSVATIRVLSVLRHWVSKHSQDFVNDTKLSFLVQEFLQDLIMDTNLLPAEHKAALQLQQMVQKAAHSRGNQVDLDVLLAPPSKPSTDSIETLSALEIAEGMTYLDHKIFLAIRSEEFLGQAWMKVDKAIKAPHILLITKRFNDVSRLVSSEIIRVPELHRRVSIIEKWTNVAHICRVVHNFNGVLQICAAFTNSAVFRLKKTWDKIPKTTKTTIDQLQNLVSTDSRFRNMRDAINRCDPPSIPYVGMYLTDLSFIEEGTPNYSPEGLLNFSKMRMIAHVIREIQHLQNGSYKIELNSRVANYLLDSSRHLHDDEMYKCSLAIEPRSSGSKNGVQILNNVSANQLNGPTSQQQSTSSKSGSSTGGTGSIISGVSSQQARN